MALKLVPPPEGTDFTSWTGGGTRGECLLVLLTRTRTSKDQIKHETADSQCYLFFDSPHTPYSTPTKLPNLRDWSLNTGRGWGQNEENSGYETCCAPPPSPQDRVKLVVPPPPPFERVETFCAPTSIWLKLQATMYKLPQPSAWLKLCSPPPPLPLS